MEANLRQYAQYIPRISTVESLPYFQSKTHYHQDLLQALKEKPSTTIAAIIVELLELKILLKFRVDRWTKKEWESYFYSYLPSCYTSYQLSPILNKCDFLPPLPQNLVAILVWFYEEEYWNKLPIPTETNTWADHSVPQGEDRMSDAQGDLCRFPFVKYNGQAVDSMLSNDPSYITWIYQNVDGQSIVSYDMFVKAYELLQQMHRPYGVGGHDEESQYMSLKGKLNSDVLNYSEKRSLIAQLGTFEPDKVGFCLINGIFYPTNNFTIDKDRLSQKIKIPKIGARTLKTILDAFECKYTIVENQKNPILIVDDSSTMQDLPFSYEPEILSKITRDLADIIPLDFPVVNHPPQPYKFVTKNSSPLDELVKSVKEINTHV